MGVGVGRERNLTTTRKQKTRGQLHEIEDVILLAKLSDFSLKKWNFKFEMQHQIILSRFKIIS